MSETSQQHLRRVASPTTLTREIKAILDTEVAPFKICRWVAWGSWLQDRAVRLALALAMRVEADISNPGSSTTGWAWPQDYMLSAAEKAFRASPQYARLVQLGVLSPSKKVPANRTLFIESWSTAWGAIQREVATMTTLRDQALRIAAARKPRRAAVKRRKLQPHEVAYVEALNTLKLGLLRGDISVGELSALPITNQPQPNKVESRKSK